MTISSLLSSPIPWIVGSLTLNLSQHILAKHAAHSLPIEAMVQGAYPWHTCLKLVSLNPYLWGMGLSLLLGAGIWLQLLKIVPLGVAVPLLSLNYLILALIGAVFFGEPLSVLKIGGILLIISGVFCLTR